MQRVGSTGRQAAPRNGRVVAVVASAVALMGLAACTSGGNGTGSDRKPAVDNGAGQSTGADEAPSSAKPTASAAVITTSSVGGTSAANPAKPVTVGVSDGKLSAVKMVNANGKVVRGAMSGDGASWRTTEDLGYGKTYSLTASAKDDNGLNTVKRSKITTLEPDNMTLPYFQTLNGSSMDSGATYGVGMVTVVHFDEAISNKAAAEKSLVVTTSPHVDGAWYWTDDQTAHWRPQRYYQPGTTVSVKANAYGVDFGNRLYGESDVSTSFKVGAKHYSVASAKTHHVKVYDGGKLVRNMPTSMGQGGTTRGKFGQIYLWTPPGAYTVITHENPAVMSSDSYGLPASSPLGYGKEKVYWSTKISTDGIYLHELTTTIWAQGHQNVSHGCLNLNTPNSKWFYGFSRVGDVVTVIQSGGPGVSLGQGGDWSVPWSQWVKGGEN